MNFEPIQRTPAMGSNLSSDSEHALHYGATAMLRLRILPSETSGLYRAGIYSSLLQVPLYESASDSSLVAARAAAVREATL